MTATLAELQELEASLDARKQFLAEKEEGLNALAVQLSQVPAKVKELELREEKVLAREQAVAPQEYAVSDAKASLAARTKAIELTEASQVEATGRWEAEQTRLSAWATRLQAQEAQQAARSNDLDEKEKMVLTQASLNAANDELFKTIRETFDAERIKRVRDEEMRLKEQDDLLRDRERILEAKVAEIVCSSEKIAEQTETLNVRMDVCVKLEVNLASHATLLAAQEQSLKERELACQVLEAKQASWKEGLELTELRLEKRKRELDQLIEKHELQSALKSSDG